MSGTVAVTQAKFEKLTGNDEANHQVGKAAGILHLLCRNPASLCRNALAVGRLLLLQVGVDDSCWSHLCCVRISPEGRSVSAGWGVWVLFPALLSAIVWDRLWGFSVASSLVPKNWERDHPRVPFSLGAWEHSWPAPVGSWQPFCACCVPPGCKHHRYLASLE